MDRSKVEKVINADYRKPEGRNLINKTLMKFKPFKNISSKDENNRVRLSDIERLIIKIHKQYAVKLQWIMPTYTENEKYPLYSASIKNDVNGEWIGSVHGICLYEVMAKVVIVMYAAIKSGKVSRREE